MNQELGNYIQQARASGANDQQIFDALRAHGWSENDINEALGKVPGADNYSPSSMTEKSGFLLRHKKLTIFVVVIIGVILLATIFPQIYLYPYYRYDLSMNADDGMVDDLNAMPSMRTITPEAVLSSRSFEFDGLSFRFPWDGEPTIRTGDSFQGFFFPNNVQFVVFKEGPCDCSYPETRDSFNMNLADLKFNSDIRRWSERIAIKAILAINTRFGFYEFQYGDIRGFQMGDPLKNDPKSSVVLLIFNEKDELREIFIKNAKSQAEIDSVISAIDY